jgi:sterol 14-demethylase
MSLAAFAVAWNLLKQLFFYDRSAPPVVFHFVPFWGSSYQYTVDPYEFVTTCAKRYGDVFTFKSLGHTSTVCLGAKGNRFILEGDPKVVSAKAIYRDFSTPVFGSVELLCHVQHPSSSCFPANDGKWYYTDVVYDCPDSKFMEQKRFISSGLNATAFRSYVPLIVKEVERFVTTEAVFEYSNPSRLLDVNKVSGSLTLNASTSCLHGPEMRARLDTPHFLQTLHDLEGGFSPENFLMPWALLPHNPARDRAHTMMTQHYLDIIHARQERQPGENDADLMSTLMSSIYKDGTPVPDKEVAHMMTAMMVAGHHSSASVVSWMMLRLATRPDLQDELLAEQKRVLGEDDGLSSLDFAAVKKLHLHGNVVKETLRLHGPMHSLLRKVESPVVVTGTFPTASKEYVIPAGHLLLSSICVNVRDEQYFPSPWTWEPRRWEKMHPLAKTGLGAEKCSSSKEDSEDYGYGIVAKGAGNPYLPFGAGRHRCAGEQFAYLELSVNLASLVRLVKFKVATEKFGGSTEDDVYMPENGLPSCLQSANIVCYGQV